MTISAKLQTQATSYPRHTSKNDGPDDVHDEFDNRRGREPGPDDVYDEFDNRRGGDSYDGPHYSDGGGGGGGWVLF